ncbi:MAG: YIP1 family protein [Vulcanimicrobiaceae bacterium]
MDIGPATAPKGSALATIVDTIVAPKEAFERLREAPTWGIAALVIAVLTLIAAILALPVNTHIGVAMVQHMIVSNPTIAGMSDAEKQKMLDDAMHPAPWKSYALNPLLGVLGMGLIFLCNALFLLLGSAIGRGTGSFRTLWAASVNIGVPTAALSQLVIAVIGMIRGPEAFGSMTDLVRAVPSLGWIVPGAGGLLGATLSSISVFLLWGLFLNFNALRYTAQVRGAVAWVVPAIVTILGGLATGGLFLAAQKFT